MKKIAILGSTGSIGTQTLDVISQHPQDLSVAALAAGSNIVLLEQQIRQYHPLIAAVWDAKKAAELKIAVSDLDVKIVSGMEGMIEVVTLPEADIVVTAGDDRYPSDYGSYQSRQRYRTGQQRDVSYGRPSDYADGKGLSCADPAGRQ